MPSMVHVPKFLVECKVLGIVRQKHNIQGQLCTILGENCSIENILIYFQEIIYFIEYKR